MELLATAFDHEFVSKFADEFTGAKRNYALVKYRLIAIWFTKKQDLQNKIPVAETVKFQLTGQKEEGFLAVQVRKMCYTIT